MRFLFSNNAETTLDVGIDGTETNLTVTGDDTANGKFENFLAVSGGAEATSGQLATLTHPSSPGVYEVVLIVGLSGLDLTVIREYEGTPQAWPAGTLISQRVTAAMLSRFMQRDPDSALVTVPGSGTTSFIFGPGSLSYGARYSDTIVMAGRSRVPGAVQLSGWPTLQLTTAKAGPSDFDRNMSHESVGGSVPVDLGSASTWATDLSYARGTVVVPTTPDGNQYWLDITKTDDEFSSSSGAEPFWNGSGETSVDKGNFYPTPIPVVVTTPDIRNILITEVGFIAHKYSGSVPPVVSIGTASAGTRFASAVSLSQITADGCVHRIPLTTGGLMVNGEGLKFAVNTAAVGGRCLGRFYWRGIFIETDSTL